MWLRSVGSVLTDKNYEDVPTTERIALQPVLNHTAWWQRNICVNNMSQTMYNMDFISMMSSLSVQNSTTTLLCEWVWCLRTIWYQWLSTMYVNIPTKRHYEVKKRKLFLSILLNYYYYCCCCLALCIEIFQQVAIMKLRNKKNVSNNTKRSCFIHLAELLLLMLLIPV